MQLHGVRLSILSLQVTTKTNMNLTTLFKKKNKRAHFQKDGATYISDPHVSWVLILKVFFSLLIVVLGLSAYKFYVTDKHAVEVHVESDSQTKEAIQTEKLDSILESFNQKNTKTKDIQTTPGVFVDPS